MEEERIGVISVIYNPHLTSTLKNLTDIEDDFRRYINSVLHVHLTENKRFEVIVVKGDMGYIRNITRKIKKLKGIQHTKLTSSTIRLFSFVNYSQ